MQPYAIDGHILNKGPRSLSPQENEGVKLATPPATSLALMSPPSIASSSYEGPAIVHPEQSRRHHLTLSSTDIIHGHQYIDSVFRRPVYWLCFQETSILALFSGDQYIGSVFRRPVHWLCFQETSILTLFSGDQYIGSVFRTSRLALFSGDHSSVIHLQQQILHAQNQRDGAVLVQQC